jgi:hypothetical protein
MLASLALPILLSAVALFFASFLSWMIVGLHRDDWRKLDNEDQLMDAVRRCNIPTGNFMFPGANAPAEMNSEEYKRKWEQGPCGIMTIYPKVSMGKNLGLTFVYFLVVSFLLAYLGSMALPAGSGFLLVFRFISTAALMAFLASMIQHAIWFHCRVVGHVIESIAYAAITAAIFAAMWPA